jgi:hypothetical protein
MKKVLLVAFAVLMLAGSVSATGYYRAYMGAYTSAVSYEEDTNYVDNHSMCSLSPELYEPFEVWIWIVPSHRGVMAVEYRLNYPTGLIKGTVIQNPLIVISLGSPATGIIAVYSECQTDWTWCHHQTIFSTNRTPRHLWIGPHPLTGLIQVAGCDENCSLERCVPFAHLYLYSPCYIGTKETSWGGIKSLF